MFSMFSGKCSAFFHYPDLGSCVFICFVLDGCEVMEAKSILSDFECFRFKMVVHGGFGNWQSQLTSYQHAPLVWSFRPIQGETIKSNLAVLRTLLTFPLFFPFFSDFLSLSWLYCLYFFLSLLATNFINTTVERSWTAKFPTFTLSRRTTWKENFSENYSWS